MAFGATWGIAFVTDCFPARLMCMSSQVKTCCLALRKGPSFPCADDRTEGLFAVVAM